MRGPLRVISPASLAISNHRLRVTADRLPVARSDGNFYED
jgi:hypothetical protein